MEHTSSEKISEALKLLEEAATQKKDELKGVISDKYTHLRKVIMETESSLAKAVADTGKSAVDDANHAKDAGVEKVREIVCDMDKKVHRNPWTYIAGTAVVGMLVGCMLSRRCK